MGGGTAEGQRRGGARQRWEEREGEGGIAGERGDGNIKILKYSVCWDVVSQPFPMM